MTSHVAWDAVGLTFVGGNGKHLVSAGRDADLCFWLASPGKAEKFLPEWDARLYTAFVGGTSPAQWTQDSPVNVRITHRGPHIHVCGT